MLLSIENLKLTKGKEILKGINLKLGKGEIVTIIGPNGSGKSSLLRSIMKLEDRATGQICFDEKLISTLDSSELAKYRSYAPQNMVWDFEYTVNEFIKMAKIHREDLQETGISYELILKELELTSFENRNILKLSGGERQRVLLASTIYQEADLMLLDETYSFLDYTFKNSISKFIYDFIRMSNKTVLQVSHDLNFALQNSDRVMVLTGGEISYCGKPEKIIADKILDDVFKVKFEYLKNSQPLDWIKC